MRINHNIAALNTYRQLSTNSVNGQKSLEKLSSGLRINKAGDDAAGLAISEKMRGQIRGLDQASRNAQDGISLIQTAEGALNETHSILQRVRELAVQAANSTNNETDRGEIQNEINQLTSEINRIGNTTEFNTQKLLNGGPSTTTYSGGSFGNLSGTNVLSSVSDITGANTLNNGTYTVATESNFTKNTGVTVYASADTKVGNIAGFTGDLSGMTITWTDAGTTDGTVDLSELAVGGVTGWSISGKTGTNGTDLVISITDGTQSFDYNMGSTALVNTEAVTVGDITGTPGATTYSGNVTFNGETVAVGSNGSATFAKSGVTIDFSNASSGTNSSTVDITGATPTTAPGIEFSADLQIGANTAQNFTIKIDDMRADALDISSTDQAAVKTVTVDGQQYNVVWNKDMAVTNGTSSTGEEYALDVSTHDNATAAIGVIDEAINKVSSERSKLGAYQNRLEHTINNLGTSSENLTAAESRIRDVDMAKEMMEFTKNNILSQAAQAMLAQANQQPQGVLQLLR